jgi:hypothetical protein
MKLGNETTPFEDCQKNLSQQDAQKLEQGKGQIM